MPSLTCFATATALVSSRVHNVPCKRYKEPREARHPARPRPRLRRACATVPQQQESDALSSSMCSSSSSSPSLSATGEDSLCAAAATVAVSDASASSPRARACSRAVAKRHAAAAMRGLSDTAWCAVLTELGRVCGADTVGGVAEAGIAFGGLTGLWTAAFVLRAVREHARRCADAARDIVEGWDRSFLYDRGIGEDDVLEVITWMEALDELESTHGAALLWEMAGSSDPRKRRAVAETLGECGIQSNVVIGVVAALTDDDAAIVSRTANEALLKLVGDAVTSPEAAALSSLPPGSSAVSTNIDLDAEGIFASLAEQEVAAIARARAQVDAVLNASEDARLVSENILLPSTACEEKQPVGLLPRRIWDAMRVQAPLFDWLALSELRTLCVIAAIPLCYEAFCLSFGTDGWLRFVGLGWLMSIAGFVAYPQSGSLWKNLEQTVTEDV